MLFLTPSNSVKTLKASTVTIETSQIWWRLKVRWDIDETWPAAIELIKERSYTWTEAISNTAVAVLRVCFCHCSKVYSVIYAKWLWLVVCVIGSVFRYHWRGTNVRSSLISSSLKRCQNMTATRPVLCLQKYVLPTQTSLCHTFVWCVIFFITFIVANIVRSFVKSRWLWFIKEIVITCISFNWLCQSEKWCSEISHHECICRQHFEVAYPHQPVSHQLPPGKMLRLLEYLAWHLSSSVKALRAKWVVTVILLKRRVLANWVHWL